jgi:hypothetical protein
MSMILSTVSTMISITVMMFSASMVVSCGSVDELSD